MAYVHDGTGHGGPHATFITEKNGFAVGDNSPNDRVVSSGDSITADQGISFAPGPARSVTLTWDFSQAPYLEPSDFTALCSNTTLVTARPSGPSTCTYAVPEGVSEVVGGQLRVTARDTGGRVEKDQRIVFSIQDSASGSAPLTADFGMGAFTVVSAPRADVSVSLKQTERPLHDGAGSFEGYVDMTVHPVAPSNAHPTHGVSTSAPWSGELDVSAWPIATRWYYKGLSLPVTDGKIRLDAASGPRVIRYRVPTSAVSVPAQGEVRSFDIGFVADEDAFAGSGSAPQKNLGVGRDPGSSDDKDSPTPLDPNEVRDPSQYPNNNWAKVIMRTYRAPEDTTINVFIETPYNPDYLYSEPENLVLGPSTPTKKTDSTGRGSSTSRVSTQGEFRVTSTIDATKLNQATSYMLLAWNGNATAIKRDFSIRQGDRVIPASASTVSYALMNDSASTPMHSGVPPQGTRVRLLRVNLDGSGDGAIARGPGAPPVTVAFIAQAFDDALGDPAKDVTAFFTATANVSDASANERELDRDDEYIAITPQPSVNPVNSGWGCYTVNTWDAKPRRSKVENTNTRCNQPIAGEDRIHFRVLPAVLNVPSTKAKLTSRVIVDFPPGFVEPKAEYPWRIEGSSDFVVG